MENGLLRHVKHDKGVLVEEGAEIPFLNQNQNQSANKPMPNLNKGGTPRSGQEAGRLTPPKSMSPLAHRHAQARTKQHICAQHPQARALSFSHIYIGIHTDNTSQGTQGTRAEVKKDSWWDAFTCSFACTPQSNICFPDCGKVVQQSTTKML